MTDEEAEAQRRGNDFPRPHSKLALNAAFLSRAMLLTKIYLGMSWLGFVKIKSAVPTPGRFPDSIWAFTSVLFLHGLQRQGLKNGQRSHGGRLAGTEIANEEIAFGNAMKTSRAFILYLTPALEKEQVGWQKRRMCGLGTVAPHSERRG